MNRAVRALQPHSPLSGVRLARVPMPGLAALAALRDRPDVVVGVEGQEAWVAWEPAESGKRDEVAEALLPVPGVVFFRRDEGRWYRVGRRLPDFDARPPIGAEGGPEAASVAPGVPLHRVLVPGPIRWEEPATTWEPARLRLVGDDRPRPASALLIGAGELLPWAESAPTARLEALRAARSGDRVLLLGRRLPPLAGLGRYWGDRVLLPLGRRAEPPLPERRLAEALGLGDDQLALVGPDARFEPVPAAALAPLSRSSARRMAGVTEADRMPPSPEVAPGAGGRR